ncbi:MAG: type II toxin-antitoxin system VapB family antitoxin [Deltaproteobacteria bacterium]|nr:type II toxin-antitoxin system VapB family antitoxin [Deltaproteobacteria bacterium]
MKKRTNIVLDEKLIKKVKSLTGVHTKREAVQIALKNFAEKIILYKDLQKLKGKLQWSGNLTDMRKFRS